MLRVKNLNKYYKGIGDSDYHALKNINLTIGKGEFVAILGESGSGKSTLLNMISGLDCFQSGDLIINGESTKDYNKNDWAVYRNNYVGMIFQEYHLIEHLSVIENIELPLLMQGVSKSKTRQLALEKCRLLGISKYINHFPNQLSGGEAQRVAIARALITEPQILLADEPTGALDYENAELILSILKKISDEYTVLLVTHDEEFAGMYGDRIITLEDGCIVGDTNPGNYSHKNETVTLKKTRMTPTLLWKFAIHNIRNRKLRSVYTSLIMSIGLITIFLLTFLMNGVRKEVNEFADSTTSQNEYIIESEIKNGIIKDETIEAIQSFDGVSEAYHKVSVQPLTNEKIEKKRINNKESIAIYKPDFFRLESIPVLEENYKNQTVYGKYPTAKNEVLITSKMAERIARIENLHESQFIDALVSIETIPIQIKRMTHSKEYELFKHLGVEPKGEEFRIVGIISSDEYIVYALHTKMQEYVNLHLGSYNPASGMPRPNVTVEESNLTVYLNEHDHVNMSHLKDELSLKGLTIKNPYHLMQETINQFFDTSLYILLTTASISVIVSLLLIGLVVYISVIERNKEIGILGAIGAKATYIRRLFLIESIHIGLFSAIIAVVASILIVTVINNVFKKTFGSVLQSLNIGFSKEPTLFQIDGMSILIVLTVSIVVSGIIGWFPAVLASRLKIVEALKTE